MQRQISAEQAIKLLAESYAQMAKYSSDIAYARMSLYKSYISEGFSPEQALELCKIL